MELQFEKQELSCLDRAVRAIRDQEVTQEIRLSEAMPDVGRVLAGWGQAVLRGKEWRGSHISASGGVMAWILYAPEDGSEPRTVEAWIPFQLKWDGAEAEREGPMRIGPMVRFVDGRNLSARKILVRAGISCLAEGLYRRQGAVFTPPEMPEDVELLRRSYPVRLAREAGEKTFTLEETLDMGAAPAAELLSYTIQPEITECRVSGDKAVLRGLGRLHLVYRCREGRIRTRSFEIPFSQLGELEGTFPEDLQADAVMAVTSLELEMEADQLALKCGLVAQYLVSERTMVEVVEDAYSPRRDIGIRQEELKLPAVLDETRERITAVGSFPDMTLEGADGVFWPGWPQTLREGDRAALTLPGRFQLVGYDAGGSIRSAAAAWEGSTAMNVDETGLVYPMLCPVGEPQTMMTGSGMEIRAELELRTTVLARRGIPMLTGLELGTLREADPARPSLILCRPGGRRLWNIARECGSSVSAIRSANAIDEEPQGEGILLIPIP